jgi:type IV fimbrial biogenesis protein FimT
MPPVKADRGFTLLELLVTIAIAVIIIAFAIPNFTRFVQNNKMAAANNQFVSSLNYARTQAVSQRTTVTVCKSAAPHSGTPPQCDTAGANGYETGWIIFIASGGVIQPTVTSSNPSPVLKILVPDAPAGLSITGGTGTSLSVAFTPMGMSTSAGALVICNTQAWKNGGQFARVITVSTAGRIASVAGNTQTAITSCTPP